MDLILDRIDSAPIFGNEFTQDFTQWVTNLVDTLNEDIADIEESFNFLTAPNLTAVQIAAMFTAGDFTNGILLYDTTNNEYVGMQSGALVKFTTTAYP
ncbi:hypothetical protein [Pedobacter sp.]|jgi:hypothetical protein|uniref:hypothetical protein n=1 Tax=Pedobacter sp. TaxID=1411316 RepID=UPI002B6A5FF9|nr:hypothetical protein [Pedobacter sp.]HWW39674.1 hypothetical protein [Pedobacter sp.]